MSLDGKQYFFVAYDYDTKYIFALPIANVQDKTIIKAFDKIFTELTEKGQKPTFNVTDNQAVTPLKKYLRAKNCRWKFVEPAAETLGDPYHKQVPLPSIPAYRAQEATTQSQACVQKITEPKPLNQSSR